jgi:hypothetical protein
MDHASGVEQPSAKERTYNDASKLQSTRRACSLLASHDTYGAFFKVNIQALIHTRKGLTFPLNPLNELKHTYCNPNTTSYLGLELLYSLVHMLGLS